MGLSRLLARDGRTVCVLSLVLPGLISAAPVPARAQDFDGRYSGTISCAAIPGQTPGPLLTPFSMVVAAGHARYEREVMRPEDSKTRLGVTERGEGTVSPSGEVSLTGSAGRATGAFRQRIEAGSRGTPSASPARSCSVCREDPSTSDRARSRSRGRGRASRGRREMKIKFPLLD